MTIRVVDGVRRGNAEDAGRLCVTAEASDGVGPASYRRAVEHLEAPGPLPDRNPDTGEKEYDLDAVGSWAASPAAAGLRDSRRWADGIYRGNAADAGALCVTDRSADGVGPATYRRMQSQLHAPGPLPGFNPDTGEKEYDLDAVERWNRERKDKGPGSWHRDITHRTPMRHDMLSAIDARRISVRIGGDDLRASIYRDGEPLAGRANTRVFTDLQRAGMIEVPPVGGQVKLTEDGRKLLRQWKKETQVEEGAKAG